jgi:hypothetical protein
MLNDLNYNELFEVSGGSNYYKSGEENGDIVGKVVVAAKNFYVEVVKHQAKKAAESITKVIINSAKAPVFL